jgi:ankyrin repeat protein
MGCQTCLVQAAGLRSLRNNAQRPIMTHPKNALVNAAQANDFTLCKSLLDEGIDVHAIDDLGCSALHFAACRGNVEICQLLLSAGANIQAMDNTGWAPLHFAANFGHPKACRLLIEAGANLEAKAGRLNTALHYAASNGKVEACRELIQSGADLFALDQAGQKPLHVAVTHGKIEVVRFFFDECGESANQRFQGRKTLDELANVVNKPAMAAFISDYRHSLITQKMVADVLRTDAPAPSSSRSRGLSPM